MTEPRQGSMGHLPPVSPRDENPLVRPHRAGAILGLGIAGLALFPLGIVAWIMAEMDLGEMCAGRMDRAGESRTRLGRSLGIISLGLWVILIGVVIVLTRGS